jgi:hypothetical protein
MNAAANDGAGRPAPSAAEIAEQSTLGSLLIDNSGLARIDLAPAEFGKADHATIYMTIRALVSAGKPADVATVFEQLLCDRTAESCGGLGYLNALAQCVPSGAHIVARASRVREHHHARSLRSAVQRAADMLDQSDDPRVLAALVRPYMGEAVANSDSLIDGAPRHDAAPSPWAGPDGSRVGLAWVDIDPGEEAFIVDGLLPVDAVGLVGIGGAGKSSMLTWMMACIVLGLPVLGCPVMRPGPVLYISAEDRRATTERRLRNVCRSMQLCRADHEEVAEQFHIEDISGKPVRLVIDSHGQVSATAAVDQLIEKYRNCNLSLTVLDPLSLIGPGERSLSDGMAEMMRTARRISEALNCCVIVVHHETKAGAREGVKDQYVGRGGAAFADNSRGVLQLTPVLAPGVEYEGRKWAAPDAWEQEDFDAGNVTAVYLHKLTAAYRSRRPIFIRRHGWLFESAHAVPVDGKEAAEARMSALQLRVIEHVSDCLKGKERVTHSKRSLAKACASLKLCGRDMADATIDELLRTGALLYLDLPQGQAEGAKTKYLVPAAQPDLI